MWRYKIFDIKEKLKGDQRPKNKKKKVKRKETLSKKIFLK